MNDVNVIGNLIQVFSTSSGDPVGLALVVVPQNRIRGLVVWRPNPDSSSLGTTIRLLMSTDHLITRPEEWV